MIKQIILYIFKREAYNQYFDFKNSTTVAKKTAFERLGKACWYIMWAALCISIMINYSFLYGLFVFILPIALFKCVSAITSLRKKTIPVYTQTPVYKSDRRSKTGQRVSRYKMNLSGERVLTLEELDSRKIIYNKKLYYWGSALVISIPMVLFLSQTVKPNSLNADKGQYKDGKGNIIDVWNAKPNADLFAIKSKIRDTLFGLDVFQLAVPINKDDIDKMKIEPWKKQQLKDNLKTDIKPVLVKTYTFNSKEFYKTQTGKIGEFVSRDSLNTEQNETQNYWVCIKPDLKKAKKELSISIPDGFNLDTKKFYVMAKEVTMVDELNFK